MTRLFVISQSTNIAAYEVWGGETIGVNMMVIAHPLRTGDPLIIFGYICASILYVTIMLPIYFVLILYRYSPALSAMVGVVTVILTNLQVSSVVTDVLASISGILLSLAVVDKYNMEIPNPAHTTYFILNKVSNKRNVITEKNLIIASFWLSAKAGKRVATNNCEIFHQLRLSSISLHKWLSRLDDRRYSGTKRNVLNFLYTRLNGFLIEVSVYHALKKEKLDCLQHLSALLSLCQDTCKMDTLFEERYSTFEELVKLANKKYPSNILQDLVIHYGCDPYSDTYAGKDQQSTDQQGQGQTSPEQDQAEQGQLPTIDSPLGSAADSQNIV